MKGRTGGKTEVHSSWKGRDGGVSEENNEREEVEVEERKMEGIVEVEEKPEEGLTEGRKEGSILKG